MGLFGGSGHYIIYRMLTHEPREGKTDPHTDLPSYRCYGVTRKKNRVIDGLYFALLSSIALWVFGVCLLAAVMFLASVLLYGSLLVRVSLWTLGIVLLLLAETRALRKRMRFLRRLRRRCKKQGLRMKRNKPFLTSFFWTGNSLIW